MQWKTVAWSTKMHQLCCKSGKQCEIFKPRPRTPLSRDLKWINFNIILRLNKASFMCKNLYVSAYSNVKKINLEIQNKVSQRITRNGSDVRIDYRGTAVRQKALSVSGEKLWNSIPMNIRNLNTIVTFKSHMYQHLLEHQ